MPKSKSPRIAILVDTSTAWGRRLIRGVIGYMRKHGPWNPWVNAHGQDELMRLPPGWTGDGIIARIPGCADRPALIADTGLPVVDVSAIPELPEWNFCRVTTDLHATGRLGGQHLLDCGLQHFAYSALPRLAYVQKQYQGFAAERSALRRGYALPVLSAQLFRSAAAKVRQAKRRELTQSVMVSCQTDRD